MKDRSIRDTTVLAAENRDGASAAVLEAPTEFRNGAIPKPPRRQRPAASVSVRHFAAQPQAEDHAANRQAELFYLQKQIQLQTRMVFILEDGLRVQGVIEWYDRNCIKVRGKSRMLIYKSAIKYLYKAGETGSAPGE
jgi:sRNA-binding regulator protein Hfq